MTAEDERQAHRRGSSAPLFADPYRSALSHYMSSTRTDAVKAEWERPYLAGIVRAGVKYICASPTGRPDLIEVLDVGAGAGEGALIVEMAVGPLGVQRIVRYTALDRSQSMLDIAQEIAGASAIPMRTICQDMRLHNFTSTPAHLYLSAGAPCSELTTAELRRTLGNIFQSVDESEDRAVVMVDSYGQYCLAWLPVSAPRRRYAMSFFHGVEDPPTMQMQFYVPHSMRRVIDGALNTSVRARMSHTLFIDRGIFTSRHTMTGAYNSALPNLRESVNRLLAGDRVVQDLSDFIVPAEALALPSAVHARRKAPIYKLKAIVRSWNGEIESGPSTGSAELARVLCELNNVSGTAAAGIGHYMTAAMFFRSRREILPARRYVGP